MKKIITCLAVALCSTGAFAQYFSNTYNPAGMNPGGLNTDAEQPFGAAGVTAVNGYAEIIPAGTATLSWSTTQTIPFPFNFDGAPVTQYKVSTSGVLTFTTAATTVPSYTNATIPNTGIPDKSIMVWGLQQGAGGSGNDGILNKTHGTAPNRQHWINFASFGAPGASGAQWSYWGIVLEEGSNNIYIADLRTFNTPLTLTIGIQINSTTAYSIAGAPSTPSFVTNGGNASDPSDNVYYEYIQGLRPADDIEMVSLDIDDVTSNATAVAITGSLINKGSDTLNSFNLVWSADGGITNNSQAITASILPQATYNFNHTTTWTPTAGQTYDVQAYTNLPNGNVDQNLFNDSITETTFVNTGMSASKNVLLEEFTTAPCQFCPDGAVVVEQILAANPAVIAVAEHACFGTDAMTIPEASTYCSAFSGGAPTATIDRTLFPSESGVGHGRGTWAANANTSANKNTPVAVAVTGTYNPVNRSASVNVDANFVDFTKPGDLRVTLFVVEDSVTGTGSGYNQVNAYNTQAGHPYAGAGNPIVGFQHRHVLRDVYPSGNAWGQAGVIPTAPSNTGTYSQNFTFTMNAAWKTKDVSFVAFVSYFDTDVTKREILNVEEVKLNNLVTSIIEIKRDENSLSIYPNPTAGVTNVSFNLSTNNIVSLSLRDVTGKLVLSQDYGNLKAGNQVIQLDGSPLSNGIYFATITIGNETVSKKISINK